LRVVFPTETESIAKERRGLKPTWARVQRTPLIVCVHGVEQAFRLPVAINPAFYLRALR
jgi:hypothetical protein